MRAIRTDAELGAHVRQQNRIRAERQREKLLESGRTPTTLWLSVSTKAALTELARQSKETQSDIADRILSAALRNVSRETKQDLSSHVSRETITPEQSGLTPTDTEKELVPSSVSVGIDPVAPPVGYPTEPSERDARILELHRQGVSSRDIAEQVGCSKSTVNKVVKQSA